MSVTASPRVGVLLDHIESDYHKEMLVGVVQAAHQRRARTLIIPGGALTKPGDPPVARNFIYDLIAGAKLDGLLVLAGSLGNYCGMDHVRSWLPRMAHIPVVVVQLDLSPTPSVYVDNAHGTHAVVSHLIEVHHRQRIAFLRGPQTSAEGEARHLAYRQALEDHGLRVDERLISPPGALGREDGMVAVRTLLDERHLTPVTLDAIVGTNDDMALGALAELTQRGISVPDAVAIAGFDDGPNARGANPPLTTVNQLVEQQGFSAMRNLLDALENGKKPLTTCLEPAVVLRGSCGCSVPFRNNSRSVRAPANAMARTCRLALIERRATITAALSRSAAGRLPSMPGWEGKLIASLTEEFSSAVGGTFMGEIERLARRSVALGTDVMAFHDILSVLRLQLLSCATSEPELRPRIEDLFQEARYMLARMVGDVERGRVNVERLRLRHITKACLTSLGSRSFAELRDVLAEHLPRLGIGAYSVSRFNGNLGVTPELEVIARRVTGVWKHQMTSVQASQLGLDPAFDTEEALVVEPLEFCNKPVGLAVFAWGADTPLVYEQLRELLAAAVHRSG